MKKIILTCLVIFTLVYPVAAFVEDWPTAGHDVARSGRSVDVPAPGYTQEWAVAWGDNTGEERE